MAAARRERGVFLPWERRGARVRELLLARRWRLVVALVLVSSAVRFAWWRADVHARERTTREAIANVHRAAARFRADVGRCPRTARELVHPPRAGAQYLRQAPLDGWGHALYVRCPSRIDPNAVDVISAGPSGSFFTDDNVQ